MKKIKEDMTGVYILLGLLCFFALVVLAITGFNPFTDCTNINSTFITDCWFEN